VELFVGISRFPKFQKHYLHHLFGVLLAITKINGGRADDGASEFFTTKRFTTPKHTHAETSSKTD
jgi:hypothetical protein